MSILVQLIPVTAGKTYIALYDDGELYYLTLDKITYSCSMRPIRMELVEETPPMLPIDAVAARFGVSAWTIRTWCRQGRVPFVKFGRRVLVKTDDIEPLLKANYKPATCQGSAADAK